MAAEAIFFPAIAMFLLTMSVFLLMGYSRYRATATREMDARYYKLYNQGEETPRLRQISRHVHNHFEVPPLFYVVVIIFYVTGQVTPLAVGLAWAFVALRLVHTVVHLGGNVVTRRFMVFIASFSVLAVMWLYLLVRLLGASA